MPPSGLTGRTAGGGAVDAKGSISSEMDLTATAPPAAHTATPAVGTIGFDLMVPDRMIGDGVAIARAFGTRAMWNRALMCRSPAGAPPLGNAATYRPTQVIM
jgi:hypothetical protein